MAAVRAGARLRQLGRRLLLRLGPQSWWPADTPEEMAVGAVLTQAVSWRNAARAVAALRDAELLDPVRLAAADPAVLAPLIRPAGYYRAKAVKLVALARFLVAAGGIAVLAQDPDARNRLLGVHGVGPETADAIACYALGHPEFVCDAYARRILLRAGILPPEAARHYAAAHRWLRPHLAPRDGAWLGEWHALLVAVGKQWCRPRVPRCVGCPARAVCATGRAGMRPVRPGHARHSWKGVRSVAEETAAAAGGPGRRESGRHRQRRQREAEERDTPQYRLKVEGARALGLWEKVQAEGWGALSAAESGRVGGYVTRMLRAARQETEGRALPTE